MRKADIAGRWVAFATLLAVLVVAAPAYGDTRAVAGSASADESAVAARTASVVARPCFGAVARSPFEGCVDPSLRLTVLPTPDDALLEPNAPCEPQAAIGTVLVNPCTFGANSVSQRPSIALIGDSHAGHWRAAIDIVARATGAAAVSITRSGCPFSEARVVIPSRERAAGCRRWNRAVRAWLANHPEVKTIFLSQRASATYVAAAGTNNFDTAVSGDMALLRDLPATVTSIIVIRDTPLDSAVAQDCVRRALVRRQPVGTRCARVRATALRRDPAVTAARQLRGRVHVLDMTPFFCSSARCYSVVGGALVHKDLDHITTVFARTLGPFMVGTVKNILKDAR